MDARSGGVVTLPGFDAPTRTRWTGSCEIEVYEGERHCRRCSHGTLVGLGTFTQHALFYHGGYGAGEAVDVNVCLACGAVNQTRIATVRPPRRSGSRGRR